MSKSCVRWTPEQYAEYIRKQNSHPQGLREDAKLEQASGDGALGKVKAKEAATGRFLIKFTSVRKRLLDEDNLCEKWLCDCLRYSQILRDDCPEEATIQTTQRKCQKGEQEHTLIEVWQIE